VDNDILSNGPPKRGRNPNQKKKKGQTSTNRRTLLNFLLARIWGKGGGEKRREETNISGPPNGNGFKRGENSVLVNILVGGKKKKTITYCEGRERRNDVSLGHTKTMKSVEGKLEVCLGEKRTNQHCVR